MTRSIMIQRAARRWLAFALPVWWAAACAGAGAGGLERDGPGATSVPASAVPSSAVPSSAVPTDRDAAAPAPPTLPKVREVAGGFVVEPLEPAPDRKEMVGRAALVWHVVPAPPNTSGPRERDVITTRFVVDNGGRAEVVAERREAVFAGSRSLWHLASREVRATVDDCHEAGKKVQQTQQEIVYESLDGQRRTVAPMPDLTRGEWARLDLETMVGPWVVATIHFNWVACEGRPRGYTERVMFDPDGDRWRKFPTPEGKLAQHRALVRQTVRPTCGGGDEIEAGKATFRYDAQGDLLVEHGMFTNVAPVCNLGIVHVFVGTYELPAELEALGRVPAWLRVYLAENRSGGISVLPPGREDALRLEFQRLPKIAPALPLGSS